MADDESGYVHRPDSATESPSREPSATDSEATTPADGGPEFGTSGWILVGMIGVAFLLVPGAILLLPSAQGVISSFGLTLRDAYLTLPLIPAFVLGVLAVWSAIRSQSQ
ncbi:hypothetical protein NDI54_12230 [Haloarcula sp. S1AR25-5A]|uniref:Uncharacterized protein n=1 Tax=Haloarcula terrestris TaxID=2950533 RepID=A0AAE4EY80_9EURY|nr:hypothetical protein [Haloarcula terrestris]MDS0222117.1 hypothetical protein [Haloarcula terrestris]